MTHRGASFILAAAATLAAAGALASDAVQDRDRKEALGHYRAGEEARRGEDWAAAEREYRAAIRLDPLLTLAHYGLGQTYMSARQFPEAVVAFIGARDAYAKVAALGVSDRVAADQRREDEIRELKDSLRAIQSGQVKTVDSFAARRLEDRIDTLQRQRHRDDGAVEVPAEFSLALGSAYFRSGKLADAEREYSAAVKANPKLGEACNNLAVVYMLTGRFDEAEKAVQQAEKAGFKVNPQLKKDIAARKTRG